MKNILLALELKNKDLTHKILETILPIAEAFDAKCWLVHIAAPEPDFVGYGVGPQYIREMVAEELKDEHKSIQQFANILKAKGLDAEGLLIQGPTEEMILSEVEKLKIDLVVLGNKQHGFLYSTFVGSVTEDLVQDLDIPIFLVPE